MKKTSLITIGILITALFGVGIFSAVQQGGGDNFGAGEVEVPRAPLGFGEYVALGAGEAAEYVGDVSIVVTGFVYSPCPPDVQCVWSGLAVLYELRVGDQVYASNQTGAPPEGAPYGVMIQDTDYQTYATLTVQLQ